jgi:uncharacterized protein YggE
MEQKKGNTNNWGMIVIALVLLFGMALVAIAGFGVWLLGTSSQPESSITVEASSSETVKPDTAIANFVYSTEGLNADELNQEVDEKLAQITDYLKEQGIEDNNIVSNKSTYQDFRFEPFQERPDQEVLVAEVNFEVTFEDLENSDINPNEVLDALTGFGVNRFFGFQYQIDDTEEICERLENQAIEKAYESAQNRVDALGGGRIISREVLPLTGNCGQDFAFPFFAEGRDADSVTSSDERVIPELSTGEQELTANATVTVTYR